MTEQELKKIFQQKFIFDNWNKILKIIFPSLHLFNTPEVKSLNKEDAKCIKHLGNIKIKDANIGLFEVQVSPKIMITRNRVALRNLTIKFIDQDVLNGAFVFYYSSDQDDYRFTFIAKKSGISDEGELRRFETPPKRYTYVLGSNESCTTAAKRFLELYNKNLSGKEISFSDIDEAFSVEKLNKEFFKKYKEHYEKFCSYLSASDYREYVFKVPSFKDKKENAKAEKPIRDFVKLLLGRIVFLHFLQKKGWLGCSANTTDWIGGDAQFLKNLYFNYDDKNHFLSKCLNKLFFDTLNTQRENNIFEFTKSRVPYLNGGLFDNSNPEYNGIDFPEELFKDLFEFFNQYNFTIDENSPDEHEVGIDPEMLGHIFENLLEDNKDKGAFYTPKEIVHYMCRESLIQYLKTNLHLSHSDPPLSVDKAGLSGEESQSLTNFIQSQEVSQFIKDNAKEIDSLLNKVKICDPAIGSGAFPMGLLKEIFQAKILLHPHIKPYKSFNMGTIKRNIIQNSIYGVDIDSGAIDIARLRFWLALIVDEEEPQPLPNLDYKIMQGNSLLESFEGIDLSNITEPDTFKIRIKNPQLRLDGTFENGQSEIIFTDNERSNLTGLMNEYYSLSDRNIKDKLHKQIDKIVLDSIHRSLDKYKLQLESSMLEIKDKIKSFEKQSKNKNKEELKLLLKKDYKNITNLENEIKEVDNKFSKLSFLYEQPERPFFLWHLYFKNVFDEGGFNIVITNPPYLGQKSNKELFQQIKITSLGKKYHQRRMDLFYFFFHLAIEYSRPKGIISFITTNYYLTATYSDKLRQHFKNETSILALINFNEYKIFESALGQHNLITILIKDSNKSHICKACITKRVGLFNNNDLRNILSDTDKQTTYLKLSQNSIFSPVTNYIDLTQSDDKLSLESKILRELNNKDKIGEYCFVEQGIVSGADRVTKKHLIKFPSIKMQKDEGIFILSNEEIKNKKFSTIEIKKYIKKTYKNSEIEKWLVKPKNDLNVLYIKSNGKYFNPGKRIRNHLDRFKLILINRNVRAGSIDENDYDLFVKGKKYISYVMIANSFKAGNYYCLSYARRGKKTFEEQKIVNSRRAKTNIFALEQNGFYEQSDIVVTTIKPNYKSLLKINFLLALLNSKLYFFWFYNKGKRKGELLELFQKPISEAPIIIPSSIIQSTFENKVDVIIEYKKNKKDTILLENEINIMVYKLYNLTYEEVKIIDPEIEKIISEKDYEMFVMK